jgi:hypothetical protein
MKPHLTPEERAEVQRQLAETQRQLRIVEAEAAGSEARLAAVQAQLDQVPMSPQPNVAAPVRVYAADLGIGSFMTRPLPPPAPPQPQPPVGTVRELSHVAFAQPPQPQPQAALAPTPTYEDELHALTTPQAVRSGEYAAQRQRLLGAVAQAHGQEVRQQPLPPGYGATTQSALLPTAQQVQAQMQDHPLFGQRRPPAPRPMPVIEQPHGHATNLSQLQDWQMQRLMKKLGK